MARTIAALLCLLMTLAAPAFAQDKHVTMRLVAAGEAPPGGTLPVAIDARPEPGWHAYWKNPGDAGVETKASWTVPAGWSAGPLAYPVPGRLLVAGLMNYVYEAPFALLSAVAVPTTARPGATAPLRVKLDYLVCTREICVPESQELSTNVTVGRPAAAPAVRATFDGWRRSLPRPLGAPVTYQLQDGVLRLSVPYPADAALGEGWLYPRTPGLIDYAAPQTLTRNGDRLVIETRPAARFAGGSFNAVLATGNGQGFDVVVRPGTVPAGENDGWQAALIAFAGAVLGGLLLNVMPCVFPILSLKALGLARSGADAASARREALAYTAGAVLACLGLGALILALRAGGAAVGWAFQLQDPRVVVVLLALTVAIALNLSGLFELPTPRLASGGGGGAFATGALAAFIATPCTGPFMGAALGAALVLPAAAALAVFAGLGLGLALPFLAVGFVPALRRRLPRPGPWMERFRRVLAVPMWLTALALAWVLGRQAGVNAMTWGLGAALLVGFALWLAGRRQAKGIGAGAALASALGLALAAGLAVPRAAPAARTAQTAGADEPFSEARLAALRAARRPVFAYFTADWCLTCKVNERVAIEPARERLRAKGVAMLVGDWTDGDPALGRFIERHNRAGVPLYLYYPAGAVEARVLPQVLTPGMLAAL